MKKTGPEQAGTTIILTRHTDVHNPDEVLYGRLPRYRLSDLGLRQAEVTASVLAEEPVAAFYTSPQLRARQTARILSSAHPEAPVRVSRLLAEVLTGWQGRPHAELAEIHWDFYNNPMHPADESLEVVWQRLQRFVRRARRRHPGETVVGVTHGDVLMIARAGYGRLPVEVASIRNPHPYAGKGSLTRLHFSRDLAETYPRSVEYYDPNYEHYYEGKPWTKGWETFGDAPQGSGTTLFEPQ